MADGSRWTYRALAAIVGAGAEVLRPRLDGSSSPRVAIIGANHPAYVVAYFAAQTLGVPTVEIGRDEAPGRLDHMLRLARPSVIVSDRPDLAPVAGGIPVLDFREFLDAASACRPRDAVRGSDSLANDHVASVVFTSGTTGVPKGVILSHGNILFVVHAVCEYLELAPRDRYAIVLPLSHTYGKSTLLTSVAAGATSVLVRDPHDFERFFGQISIERCTILSVVPFHLNVMARRGLPRSCDLSALRAITSSGGALSWDTVEQVQRLLPGAGMFPMFGLTECATRATYLPPEHISAKRGAVGWPLRGVELQIRSDTGSPLPPCVVGRLYIRGPNVMQGYLGDAGLTSAVLADGWLDTGDLGYLDEDGCLFITGREKEIIKVAGERISPAEVEAVLVSHPDVADGAVIGEPDRLLGETVSAYVVLRPGAAGLRDIAPFCAARLSPHKIPRRFVEVDRIPRTATGKIQRHLLREDRNAERRTTA